MAADDVGSDPIKIDRLIHDAICDEQWEKARALIERELAKMPDGWKPIQLTGSPLVCAFWSLDEFLAFSDDRNHADKHVMIQWAGLSYSKLWWQLAVVNRKQGFCEDALACVANGLKLEPDHPHLWIEKGTILDRQKQYREALFAYETAATIRPWAPNSSVAWAFRRQGFELVELGRFKDAQEAYRRSLELDPDSEVAKYELDGITRHLEELGEQAEQLEDDDLDISAGLILKPIPRAENLSDEFKKLPWFERALKFPPKNPMTIELLKLVDGMTPLDGPKVVGPENYARIRNAFFDRGWEGFEEEFNRIYSSDRPDYLDIKRDLLREAVFLTKVHQRMLRLYRGEATVGEVMEEIHQPKPKQPPPN